MTAHKISDTIVILGIPISNLAMEDIINHIFSMIDTWKIDGRARLVATVNVDFVVNTLTWKLSNIRHPELLDILVRSDLVIPDGRPIVRASRLLGTPLKERVTGIALIQRLAQESALRGKSIFFLGGKGDVGQQAAEKLQAQYPPIKIAGVYSPHAPVEGTQMADAETQDSEITDRINQSNADILLIDFDSPQQGLWFDRNRYRLKVPVSIDLNETFECIAGSVKNTPLGLQKTGTGWRLRMTQHPKRLWRRYFTGFFKFGLMLLPAILYYRLKRFLFKLKHKRLSIIETRSPESIDNTMRHINIVRLPDHLDAAIVGSIKDQVGPMIDKVSNIVLEFDQVTFIDSSGLGFIITLWRKLQELDKTLFLTGLTPSTRRFFKLTRMLERLEEHICGNADEVLERIKTKEKTTGFYFVSQKKDGIAHIRLYGTMDAGQKEKINIDAILAEIGVSDCIMDLKDLKFVDSSGLMFFLKLHKHLAGLSRRMFLCHLNQTVRQLFRISKTEQLFNIRNTPEDAQEEIK
jgi:exopolysaccharide biosynthesis WecB/TagA/CpsF family protein/anti-anti-sigma factor